MNDLSVSSDTSVTQVAEESIPKKKYLFPYWSNKENRHLVVTIEKPNGQTNIASIQDPDGTNPDMKAVLEQYTEEEIDTNTKEGLDRRNEQIKQQIERRESQQARAKQEMLFNCKLEAFEIDGIKNSKNTEIKRLIRKAKSVMEVQAYATMLLMKEFENGKEAN